MDGSGRRRRDLAHHVDSIFSTHTAHSQFSRLSRGVLRLADADPTVAEVLGLCADAEAATRGYFTARHGRRIDATGLVKGWAIEQAGRIFAGHGAANFAINGGGDILAAGNAAPGHLWRVGIADPHHRTTFAGRAQRQRRTPHALPIPSSGLDD